MANNLVEFTDDNFDAEVLKSDLPVLVDFWAVWCGPCRTLGPIIESLGDKINYEKVDVDTDTKLSSEFGVRNIPTLILVKDGIEQNRLVGLQTEKQILNFYNG